LPRQAAAVYSSRMKLKQWSIPLVATAILLTLIWLAVADHSRPLGSTAQKESTQWNTGWRAEAAGIFTRELDLPLRLAAGETALTKQLPDRVHTNAYVYIKTNYQIVSASMDGAPLSIINIAAQGDSLYRCDMPWSAIPLTPDMAGGTLRLAFSGTGNKPFIEIYHVHLGTQARIQLELTRNALPSLIQSLLISLFAVALFAFAALEARLHKQRLQSEYRNLLVFVLLCGIWFFTDTDISGVNYLGNKTFLFINLASCMLMPFPFLLFCRKLGRRYRLISNLATGIIGVLLAAHFIAWLMGNALLWTSVFVYTGVCGALCMALIAVMLRHKPQTLHAQNFGAGIAIIATTGLITAVLYYLLPMEDIFVFFRVSTLLFLMRLTLYVLRANVDIELQASRLEALRIREEEYRIAVQHSDKYVLRYDVREHVLLQGDQPSPLFGNRRLIPNVPQSLVAAGMVAEESLADIGAFFSAIQRGNKCGSVTASLRNQSGDFNWYHADYTTIFDEDGKPLQAVISCYDITEQRERELAFQKWKQSYAEMPADGMNYYEYDLTRDVYISEAGHMLPPLPQEVRGTLSQAVDHLALYHVLYADDSIFRTFFDRKRLLEIYEHGLRSDRTEFRRADAQGQPFWTLASVQLIADPFSRSVRCFLLLKDIDEQKRNELLVRARSLTDPLTGLLNRIAFEEQLMELVTQHEPDNIHALLIIDVDGFKRVNDTYGHHFGDRVLIDIAGSLRAMMRSDDLIGRIGGDEYMVCLKNVREGSGFLERRSAFICQALSKQFGNDVAISGSIGLSLYPKDGRTFDELYLKADKALYYAKHHGKNRFVFYHDELVKGDVNSPSAQSVLAVPIDAETVLNTQQIPQRTLLIVDDVEMNREMLAELFKDEYHLLLAEGGHQCLDLLLRSETAISAVLLDLIMPDMDGLTVLERLQSDAYLSSIPVIVTSAADEMEYSLKAIELGATDFVSKPIDAHLVKLRVKNAVHKREMEELRAQNRFLLLQKSDESRHQDELRYLAEHDSLTNLNNKTTFYRKTRLMLDKYPDTQFVMIAFDIEKFRVINDIFGHAEGDRLLQYIAQRMQTLYVGPSTFARIDADNFALCTPYDRTALRERLADNEAELKAYDLPFDIVLVYGLYIIDDLSLAVNIMHDRAEMAKRTVKGNYVKRYAYYDDALRLELLSELDIVNNMNSALLQQQFEVYLQPKCTVATGEIVGAEALVRWNHPTRGLLAPGMFVPIFEKNGFIMKLDAWVWEEVCKLLRKWMDQNNGEPFIPVSMNVSRVNIYNPALVSTLLNLAERYGVPHRMMELEITESAYTESARQLADMVTDLRTRGFIVEMDDFGSAYSSLNMLKEIAVDSLKLDMRFLFGNDPDGRGGTILSSVVRMARYLSLPIVAEGVETAEQARFLHTIGCAVGQGYYFYRPMPIPAFEELLATHPLMPLTEVQELYPEAAMRRVWSIDGDFSLMLATIPCAASLCEMSGDNIEILRINDEYLALTQDSIERVYTAGTDVRSLATPTDYQHLHRLFRQALEQRRTTEGVYNRLRGDGTRQRLHVKVNYLSGDDARALFFITYTAAPEEGATP